MDENGSGEFLQGWITFEKSGKNHTIEKQFEYNQFIKDYFLHENMGCLENAIKAWHFIKEYKGSNTYEQFIALAKPAHHNQASK